MAYANYLRYIAHVDKYGYDDEPDDNEPPEWDHDNCDRCGDYTSIHYQPEVKRDYPVYYCEECEYIEAHGVAKECEPRRDYDNPTEIVCWNDCTKCDWYTGLANCRKEWPPEKEFPLTE